MAWSTGENGPGAFPTLRAAEGRATPDRVAFWPLETTASDLSGLGNHGLATGVQYPSTQPGTPQSIGGTARPARTSGARFDGVRSEVQVPGSKHLNLGVGDFALSLWFRSSTHPNPGTGDLLSQFDPQLRRGFHLSVLQADAACTSTANTGNLFFGLDDGTAPIWTDCGRPGRNQLPYALATFEGHLYAGTWEPDPGARGSVYRYRGGQEWVSCGSPDPANAVTALAVHDGSLYAGVARYSGTGSKLSASQNTAIGGKVYRYAGGSRWVDCGRVSDAEFIFGLTVHDGRLFATAMDAPPKPDRKPLQGLFEYAGGTRWIHRGNPGGRVAAIASIGDSLFATGYNGGALGGLFQYGQNGQWTPWGAPPNVDQTYSITLYNGELHTGTWKEGKVFRYRGPSQHDSIGRLGAELEVMGMAVYNGKLYAGSLPLAQVFRHDPPATWTPTGTLDPSPVEYRRAWSMAIHNGRLFCGVLPSGHVHALQTGQTVSHSQTLNPGWHHVVAQRSGREISLHLDGRRVESSMASSPDPLNLDSTAPWRIGAGPGRATGVSCATLRFGTVHSRRRKSAGSAANVDLPAARPAGRGRAHASNSFTISAPVTSGSVRLVARPSCG